MGQLALRILGTALLMLALCAPASATSSLSFEGGGYWIDLEVGDSDQPVIASVRFHAPGDRDGVVLLAENVVVETFDTKGQVLILRYVDGAGAVAPFTLSVHRQSGVLQIGTRTIRSPFHWTP
ncbi:hypothetical protein [Montanilutibacter psychrotolerans]|uniref:Uncharacterized protein n=1 Tax=Montanilutibacter psychrotolerans TaxID=1327343 RepID=A0A3M8SUU2_9GAMM|nr:hypothetical protein [Lysobacter psychrotolerans]RNF85101.1 hypothetical protein EER27_04790 [Lysobacter psychrotolerans]